MAGNTFGELPERLVVVIDVPPDLRYSEAVVAQLAGMASARARYLAEQRWQQQADARVKQRYSAVASET